MSDFALWEVLGTLPSLQSLTLEAIDPGSHPAHETMTEESSHRGPKYFEALETLSVTGSFFFIQHLLGFIDSPCLATIKVYPVLRRRSSFFNDEDEPDYDNHLTPSMTIIASKWPQSLENLLIGSCTNNYVYRYAISKCLMLLKVLHEMHSFTSAGRWKMLTMMWDVWWCRGQS